MMQADLDARIFKRLVHSGAIRLAGNRKLKIYGKLNCASGKRMKKANRIFFSSEQEAVNSGYRPCGHCMREAYKLWMQSKGFQSRSGRLKRNGSPI
jgi:methylphosphotriester-DNA--protein-cysteine methyltransferase